MDHYFQVFYEAAWSASIIPLSSDATFTAMQLFGGYDMRFAAMLAVTGATLGQIFNLMVGRFLLTFHKRNLLHVSDYWYARISTLFNKYGVFLILFSWVSIMKVVLVLAGFLDTRIRFVLPLIVIGQLYHYGSYLL